MAPTYLSGVLHECAELVIAHAAKMRGDQQMLLEVARLALDDSELRCWLRITSLSMAASQ